MKIVFLSHIYPSLTQTFTYNELVELKKNGFDIQAYSFKRPSILNLTTDMREAVKDTIYFPSILDPRIFFAQIYFLFFRPVRYLKLFVTVFFARHQQYTNIGTIFHNLVDFLRGVYLASILKEEQKFVHIHTQFIDNAATAAFICKRLEGINFSFRNYTRFNPALAYRKIKEAEFIIACSRFDKILLSSWSSKEFKGKIYVNYLGVPSQWKRNRIGEEDNIILAVGTLSETKGYEFLIKACKILKDYNVVFRCIIVGDGPERKILERYIREYGLVNLVELTGYKPHTFVKEIMKECSVFALPCVVTKDNDMDGIPFVLMEAMALGKPCVSTPVSGIPELIEDDINGLLVPQRDSMALAEALKLLLKDKQLKARLGTRASQKISRDFNLEINMRQEAGIFRQYNI